MTLVRIPASMRHLTRGKAELECAGTTLREVLLDLERLHPGFAERLLDMRGLRRFVNVFVGAESVRFTGGLDTVIGDARAVTIVPAMAGG